MATGTQIETKCLNMDIKVSECSSSIEKSIKKVECTEHANESCQGDTDESKGDEDTGEKTSQTKKRYRSEKQRERTRQYKKKIRRAKKQMMREKKLAEKNNHGGHMTDGSCSLKPQGPESGTPSTRLLQTCRNNIEQKGTGEHKNPQKENLAEQVSVQLRPAVDHTKVAEVDADKYEDKLLDSMNDDSLSLKAQSPQIECATAELLTQTEAKLEPKNVGVDKNLSKGNLAEQIYVQINPSINLTTQASFDADIHENIIPDDNTEGDSLSLKLQEFETDRATGSLLSLSEDKIESENTGTDNNLSRENLVEPAFVHFLPAVNITTETAVDEARHKDLILDNNTADRQDIFGILSVYVDSSIHCDYDKDLKKTRPTNAVGYAYFSMEDFWK